VDHSGSLQAYPNIRAAAEMLGIAASTLSRRDDLAAESRGERDRVLSAIEVLRLAAIYRKRSLNDVAQDLIDHARKASAEEAFRIEEDVENFFEERAVSDDRRDEFLALGRRLLPASIYEEVEKVVLEQGKDLPDVLIGDRPLPSS
jgi:hypothetical protein